MQDGGMVLGGHSPQHQPLATLSEATLAWGVRIYQQFMYEDLVCECSSLAVQVSSGLI